MTQLTCERHGQDAIAPLAWHLFEELMIILFTQANPNVQANPLPVRLSF